MPERKRRNGALGPLTREARAIARQGELMLRGLLRARRSSSGERVAIFVHGLGATGPVFDPMREHVERTLGLVTLDYTYVPLRSFERVAERLAAFIEREIPKTARISLVGHSLGGLVARWYVQELGGHRRVDRLVLLATPHQGTTHARYGIGPVITAIRPDSEVIAQLSRSRDVARSIPHHAIVAGLDRMCSPPSSAALEGAAITWFDELGHNEMLFDARVFAVVSDALR